MKTRPELREVPIPNPFPPKGKVMITMSPGQWDTLLSVAYGLGVMLLEIEEVDGEEKAVRAFQKEGGV